MHKADLLGFINFDMLMLIMDLFNAYLAARSRLGNNFGNERFRLAARERIHVSLSTIANSMVELQQNKAIAHVHSDLQRYVLCKGITYDLLISLFDVNTSSLFAFRASTMEKIEKPIRDFLSLLRRPNLELRAIGMQNMTRGYDASFLALIEQAYKAASPHVKLVEVDLFGNEQRHIAIDTKLGMTFDVLLLDRFYRPPELANTVSIEQFNQSIASVFGKK